MTFNIGDVVYLKSGSPAMTITADNEGVFACVCINGSEAQEYDFPAVCLTSERRDESVAATLARIYGVI